MFALLLACTGNLVSRVVEFGKVLEQSPSNKTAKKFVITLSVALVKQLLLIIFSGCLNAYREVNCTHATSGNQLRNRKHVSCFCRVKKREWKFSWTGNAKNITG